MTALALRRAWPVVAWYAVVVVGLIITLMPFLWAAAGSLKDNHQILNELNPFTRQSPAFTAMDSEKTISLKQN